MGEFVGDDVGHPALLVLTGGFRVDQHRVLAVGDGAEVLHRSEREVGDGDEIDLVADVRDAVVGGEPAEGIGADVERERGEVSLARGIDDPEGHTVDIDRVGDFERSDDERHQVGGHDR